MHLTRTAWIGRSWKAEWASAWKDPGPPRSKFLQAYIYAWWASSLPLPPPGDEWWIWAEILLK